MDVPPSSGPDDDRPDREFARLRPAFARQLEQWPDFARRVRVEHDVRPVVVVEEDDERYLVAVELPGVEVDDIDLQVRPDRISLTAERRAARPGHGPRAPGRFALDLALPVAVDADGVTARLDHGVLAVDAPKTERGRRRRIPLREG